MTIVKNAISVGLNIKMCIGAVRKKIKIKKIKNKKTEFIS
jgi:hypothetical protein